MAQPRRVFKGREEIVAFLKRELDYRLMKELGCYQGNHISCASISKQQFLRFLIEDRFRLLFWVTLTIVGDG